MIHEQIFLRFEMCTYLFTLCQTLHGSAGCHVYGVPNMLPKGCCTGPHWWTNYTAPTYNMVEGCFSPFFNFTPQSEADCWPGVHASVSVDTQ